MGKRWVYDPHSGGVNIPDTVRRQIKQRILAYAEEHFAGRYTRIDVRFRGKFCYIDAYTEPQLSPGWPPEDYPETREQMIERYEPSYFPNGTFKGTPEEAFHTSADVYL
jgi:hypothetical protein